MIIRKGLSIVLLLAFFVQYVMPVRAELVLPPPGQMVALSPAFNPPVLKGIKVYPDNPLRFDSILDKGEDQSSDEQIKTDSTRLIKYFLASLTIPEKDLWVNLSPYEKDRIVPEAFGQTEMGRDLLAQDYLLKQITASVIYPEGDIGIKFWKKIYALAQEKYGTTDIPVDTFNKVWIVPEKAVVYENGKVGVAYVTESRLKVMLESDYLAQEKNAVAQAGSETNEIAKEVMRAVVIPELEREVNEGKNFAKLRQVYQSLILAEWYKKKIKQSLLSAVYVDQKKTDGVNNADPKEAEKIWGQYVEAFKKGAYNFVKEERDSFTDEVLPRKYLSGGIIFSVLIRESEFFDASMEHDSIFMLVRADLKANVDSSQDTNWDVVKVSGSNYFESILGAIKRRLVNMFTRSSPAVNNLFEDKDFIMILVILVENYFQHEIVQNSILYRVQYLETRRILQIDFLGDGKNGRNSLPDLLADRFFTSKLPPWDGIAPEEARSEGTQKGMGLHFLFQRLSMLERKFASILGGEIAVGWEYIMPIQGVNLLGHNKEWHRIVLEIPLKDFSRGSQYSSKDVAKSVDGKKGGIDFNANKLNLKVESAGNGLDFKLDPAQLQQLQNATGFSPVIIGIQPINSLNGFLGLADQPASGIKPG